jgi:outer membrane lipoprotein-sorting protein
MRKTVVFIAGIAAGVFLARQIETNPEAKKTLDEIGAKIKTFATAVSEGYREQEAKASRAAKSKTGK